MTTLKQDLAAATSRTKLFLVAVTLFGLIVVSVGMSGARGSGSPWASAMPAPGATPKCQELVTCAFQRGSSVGFLNEHAWDKMTSEEREHTCRGLEMLDIDEMIRACRAGEGMR